MRAAEQAKLVTVYVVVIDLPDGTTQLLRFLNEMDARTLARRSTLMGKPATVTASSVTKHIAKRWGI